MFENNDQQTRLPRGFYCHYIYVLLYNIIIFLRLPRLSMTIVNHLKITIPILPDTCENDTRHLSLEIFKMYIGRILLGTDGTYSSWWKGCSLSQTLKM